jgi:hypothetical protein
LSIPGVSGDAGRWGDRASRKTPAEIEPKPAQTTNGAPQDFDVALRYGATPTPNQARVDVPKPDRGTTDGLDRLTTAQRNAVLNRNAAASAPAEPAESIPMSPQPLSAAEIARRSALDAIAAYKRNSTPS